jgi:hypothetical protein
MTRGELEALMQAAAEGRDLVTRLAGDCWPGGADRTIAPARAWLRGWGPYLMSAPGPWCTCRSGRCTVCN